MVLSSSLTILLLFAAACGSTTTTGGGAANSSTGSANPLAGKPLENHLEIYNWSEPSACRRLSGRPAARCTSRCR